MAPGRQMRTLSPSRPAWLWLSAWWARDIFYAVRTKGYNCLLHNSSHAFTIEQLETRDLLPSKPLWWTNAHLSKPRSRSWAREARGPHTGRQWGSRSGRFEQDAALAAQSQKGWVPSREKGCLLLGVLCSRSVVACVAFSSLTFI